MGSHSYGEEHVEGLEVLAEGLRANQTLRSISLQNNVLGPLSAAALACLLRGEGALATIDLSSNFLVAELNMMKVS